jgi:threonine synthase
MSVLRAYRRESGDARPCVVASTASPFKFGRAVAQALGMSTDADDFKLCARLSEASGVPVPQAIAELPELPVRHTGECDPAQMFDALMKEMDF